MNVVHAATLAGPDERSVRTGVRAILDATGGPSTSDGDADPVVVVPDVHYPHHRSTGLVTNPSVVDALASELVDRRGPDAVAVAVSGTPLVDAERVARYLGYERRAAERGVDLLSLDDAPTTERTVDTSAARVTLDVPEPLLDRTVVAVPSLRTSPGNGIEGGLPTIARAVTADPGLAETLAAREVCAPAFCLTDATYSFAGAVRRSLFLLGGANAFAVDDATRGVLGLSRDAVPYLDTDEAETGRPNALSGATASELASRLPDSVGQPKRAADDDLLAAGYRLYARLTGDHLPPQMQSRTASEESSD